MNRSFRVVSALLALLLTACQSPSRDRPMANTTDDGPVRVYFGTYTGKDRESKGIYVAELDRKTGSLSEPRLAAETTSPSFLAVHPSRKFVYAVNEVPKFQGQETGSVSAFSINEDGTLTPLNQQPSGGGGPCHLDVDPAGRNVLVANYGGGSVAVLPTKSDGTLQPPATVIRHEGSSVNKQRQESPHCHCVRLAPGSVAVVADLGLDKVFLYELDAGQSSLELRSTATASPGAGPRHVTVHPGGKWLYVNNELNSTVSAFSLEGDTPKEIQTLSTLPEGYDGSKNSTAEIAVHPSGKFVYVSNRGHDSIAIFRVDEKTGRLTAAGHESTGGKSPRNFAIAPGGKYLLAANQNSDSVVVLEVDEQTGDLTPTGTTARVPTPVCVTFVAR